MFESLMHILGLCPDHFAHWSIIDAWQNFAQASGDSISSFFRYIGLKAKNVVIKISN